MRILIALLLLAMAPFQAQAYDEDTHFYGTYAMARYAGIKHEAAVKIGLSAQWMDESFVSDPMSLMFLGLSGVKKRRMLHFPADRFVGKMNAKAQQYTYGVTFQDVPAPVQIVAVKLMKSLKFPPKKLMKMNFLTEVEKDHFLATQLLRLGLENGDLMQAAASLHVLEDSFAHAGTPAGEGHRGSWHWPDRPYHNVKKYFEMTEVVFQALTAIRHMLPESALDCSLSTTSSGKPNCRTTARRLQAAYSSNPEVKRIVSINVLKDPEYVAESVKSVLQIAASKEVKYINMNEEQIEARVREAGIDGSKDVYETVESLITEMAEEHLRTGSSSLNIYAAIADIFQIKTPSNEELQRFIRNYGIGEDDDDPSDKGLLTQTGSPAFKKFASHISKKILRWYVPRELNNDDHRQESELDSDLKLASGHSVRAPRNIEMEIRVRNMQSLVHTLFGKKIEMVPNNSKDDTGFAHEIWMRDEAKPKAVVNPKPGVEYVTFNLEEKNRWNHMIFHYLHPRLTDDDLRAMVDAGAAVRQITERAKEMFADLEDKKDAYGNVKDDEDEETDDSKESWMPVPIRIAGAAMAEWGEVIRIINSVRPFALNWLRDLVEEPKTKDNYSYHSVHFLRDLKLKTFLTENDTWNEQLAVNSKRPAAPAASLTSSDSEVRE
jgi:hypothetical protein